MSIEILDEVHDETSQWGPKSQGTVKVSNGIEHYEKKMNFNQPFKNFLVGKFGGDSKKWVGKKVGITTKLIKGNDAIVPLTE